MKRIQLLCILSIIICILSTNICFAADVSNFLESVVPRLLQIKDEMPILKQAFDQTGEYPLDTLTFAYRFAIKKEELESNQRISLGTWTKRTEENVIISLSILCPIMDILHIRKTKNYRNSMTKIRPIITRGAYLQMIKELSITEQAYLISLKGGTL